MSSFCRSAAAAARSAALRSRSQVTSPFPVMRPPVAPSRLRRSAVTALAGAESLMPLHSAVAGARLRSCIAADSSCWSCLSRVTKLKKRRASYLEQRSRGIFFSVRCLAPWLQRY